MSTPERFEDFRVGDEPEDARIGDFKVYGGSPSDRASLQESDPELLGSLEQELEDIVRTHQEETQAE